METVDLSVNVVEPRIQSNTHTIKALISNSNRYAVQKSQLYFDPQYFTKKTQAYQTPEKEAHRIRGPKGDSNYQNPPSARDESVVMSSKRKEYPYSARSHSGQPPQLQSLSLSAPFAVNLSKKNVDCLPIQVLQQGISSLIFLDLSYNRFTAIPQEILHIRGLKTLKLDHNLLTSLPAEISQLTNLENLSVSNNSLTSIPKSISKLRKTLSVLNIGKNKIESIPKEICELSSLTTLWLNSNAFSSLPANLDSLVSLKEFAIEWFKYTNPPMGILQNDKSRLVIEHFFKLCKQCHDNESEEITFTDFIEHFSAADGKSLFTAKDSHNRNILHIAALEEEVGIVKHLLLKVPHLSDELDQDQQSPLSLAIREDCFLSAKAIITGGANPNLGGGAFGSSLHLAITKMELELIRELLKRGANPNEVDIEGNTPLHLLFLIFSKNSRVAAILAELLVNQGADPNAKNYDGWGPIHLAVRRGHIEGLRWMLNHNKQHRKNPEKQFCIDNKGGADEWTALHLAANLGHFEIVSMLIDNGADLSVRTKTGKSPRNVCANNILLIKLLRKGEVEWITDSLLKHPRENLNTSRLQELSSNIDHKGLIFNPSDTKEHMQPRMMLKREDINTLQASKGSKSGHLRPDPRSFSFLNAMPNESANRKDPQPQKQGSANQEGLMIAMEDSTICDVEEQTSRDYGIKETSIRTIPKSPNNIQKLQVAQSYRTYMLNQAPIQSGLLGSHDLISQALSTSPYKAKPLYAIHPAATIKPFGQEKSGVPMVKPTHRYAFSTKAQSGGAGSNIFSRNAPESVSHKRELMNQLKVTIPSEVNGYIHSFTSCSDEIKKFQNLILDDELTLSERLKYVFYLKVLHMKINQKVQRLNCEMMPLELFIINEFIDDEVKRDRGSYTKSLKHHQNSDISARSLLFAFENLEIKHSARNIFLKTEICKVFGQISYLSSKYFLEQSLKSPKIGTFLKKEVLVALQILQNVPIEQQSQSPVGRASKIVYSEAGDNEKITPQIGIISQKNAKKRSESADPSYKLVKPMIPGISGTKNPAFGSENLLETESVLAIPRTLLEEGRSTKFFKHGSPGGGRGDVRIKNSGNNEENLNEDEESSEKTGFFTNKNVCKPAGLVISTELDDPESEKPIPASSQTVKPRKVINFNIEEGHPKKLHEIMATPKKPLMCNYFSSKY